MLFQGMRPKGTGRCRIESTGAKVIVPQVAYEILKAIIEAEGGIA